MKRFRAGMMMHLRDSGDPYNHGCQLEDPKPDLLAPGKNKVSVFICLF